MTTCPACNGTRTITEYVPETRTGVSHPDGWGGAPARVTYRTGREVARLHQCELCKGSGQVADLDLVLRATAEVQLAFSDRAHQMLDGRSHPLAPHVRVEGT